MDESHETDPMTWMTVLAILLYTISRMILAVLMIRFLFYIPPEAFLTSRAGNLPHI